MSTPTRFDDNALETEGIPETIVEEDPREQGSQGDQGEHQVQEEFSNPNNATDEPAEETQEDVANPLDASITFRFDEGEGASNVEVVSRKEETDDIKEKKSIRPLPMFGDTPKNQNFRRTTSVANPEPSANQSSYETPKYLVDAHKNMMQAALYDAGRFCHGVKRIEVWIYDPVTGRLDQPTVGSWTDPVYQINDDTALIRSLREVRNPTEKLSYAPGEGLPGILWTESKMKNIVSFASKLDVTTMANVNRFKTIKWRDVKALAEDPDQPYNPRLMTIAKAGFRLAAGVPFDIRGTRGVVIYMARDTVDKTKLMNRLNEEYILASAGHIGSVQALRQPRRLATAARRKEIKGIFQKFKKLLPLLKDYSEVGDEGKGKKSEENAPQSTMETPNNTKIDVEPEPTCTDKVEASLLKNTEKVMNRLRSWKVRMHGGNVQPPPGMASNTAIYVVFAAFLTCFIMAYINTLVKKNTPVGFEMGQIAGAATMVFTLTSSPAAQPRSIILGRLVSLLVGLIFNLIPIGDVTDQYDEPLGWVRYAGAVATSSALMASLGIAHPPGGSLANVFAFNYSFREAVTYQKIGVLLLQDSVFVVLASTINNFGDAKGTKPYPSYWGHLPNMLSRYVRSFFEEKDIRKED